MATVVAKGDRLVSAYQAGAILARAAILEGEDGHADMSDLVDSFEVGYMEALKESGKTDG
ncbi:hypothetical protein QEH42_gp123 [Microbacterium phage Pumpernickel]|uniref:Uncharacterized protein n=1 Tax=Microbacterium phage Pumpernickel TaxID=2885983 RepID=A0AAE8Y7G8_9CAUD|nr:hypothetical protein QEH42_gp044 [Microbacterium phage Pumpernickel]YP_010755335.1 hypothetical protein QEH42_gp123 [Microbacterium phage Pumpernickel]UDL15835.1 hypothetical protein SEA_PUMPERNICKEL_44 [Microbacterium phage Pumpernickel]UDL16095.1 hypothetical protein SEA_PUMPERNICKEL_345 [Microbacterium phage Pumpernickel]